MPKDRYCLKCGYPIASFDPADLCYCKVPVTRKPRKSVTYDKIQYVPRTNC
jgi:hypothetical protein